MLKIWLWLRRNMQNRYFNKEEFMLFEMNLFIHLFVHKFHVIGFANTFLGDKSVVADETVRF